MMNDYQPKTPMWTHQRIAFEFALSRAGAAILLGMGCGKTKVAIDDINAAGHSLVLIIGLKVSMDEGLWERQFSLHSPNTYTVVNLNEGTSSDKADILREVLALKKAQPHWRVAVVTNYESAWRGDLGKLILKVKWDCVLLDEAHRISHPGTKISRFCSNFVRKGRSRQRIALTGSPMASSPLGVYSIFKFLDPTVFGTDYSKFKNKYAVMGGYNQYQVVGYKNLDILKMEMSNHSVYMDSRDALDLPPVMHRAYPFHLEASVKKVYDTLKKQMVAAMNGEVMTASNALVKMLRLQQITGGYFQPDGGEQTQISTAKQDALREVLIDLPLDIIDDTTMRRAPTVVFARFTEEIDDAAQVGRDLGFKVGILSGQHKNLDQWRDGSIDMLVVQTRSGSESIDLTRARYGIYYSKEHSLGLYEQSMARLHRPGQINPVLFIHLIARDTIDVSIERAIAKKADVVKYLLENFMEVT